MYTLSNTVALSHMWLLNIWNVASTNEELQFLFYKSDKVPAFTVLSA